MRPSSCHWMRQQIRCAKWVLALGRFDLKLGVNAKDRAFLTQSAGKGISAFFDFCVRELRPILTGIDPRKKA